MNSAGNLEELIRVVKSAITMGDDEGFRSVVCQDVVNGMEAIEW